MSDNLIVDVTVPSRVLDASFFDALVGCFQEVGIAPSTLVICEFEEGTLTQRKDFRIKSVEQIAQAFARPSPSFAIIYLGFDHPAAVYPRCRLWYTWSAHCNSGWSLDDGLFRIEVRISGSRYFYDERERDALLRLHHACNLMVEGALGASEAQLLHPQNDDSWILFFRITQHERQVMDERVLGVGYCTLHDCFLQWLQDPDCPIVPLPSKDPVPFPEISQFGVAPTIPILVNPRCWEFVIRGEVGQTARMECCPCCGGVLPQPKYAGLHSQRADALRTDAWLRAIKVRRLRDLDSVVGKPGGRLPPVKVEYRQFTPILMQRVYWDVAEDFAIIAKEYDDEHIVLNFACRS